MNKIIRTPTRAEGGLTHDEQSRLKLHSEKWIANAMQTGRTDRVTLTQAIKDLYRVSGLAEPIVVVVPSPFVMAVAGGLAAEWWATYAATDAATDAATRAATYAATYAATDAATRAATYAATRAATRAATDAATPLIKSMCDVYVLNVQSACKQILQWGDTYQGGNMWSAWDCFLTGARDVLGLRLAPHDAYKSWESAAKLGGFRVMHSKFCMVCDFPDVLKVDSENRPHCDDGPSHRWSDGWALWHIDGISVDEQLVMRPESQTIKQIDSESNQDIRAIRIERYGWDNYLRDSKAKCIDYRDNEIEGTKEALYQTNHGDKRLVATCATGRVFAMGVPAEVKDCESAQEWLAGGKRFRLVART